MTPTNTDLKAALEARLSEIGGCSDGDCKVIRPRGQHTNGGCRCLRDPLTAERVLRAWQDYAAKLQALSASPVGSENFQSRVVPWLCRCFGREIAGDKLERGDRLLEEVLELLQSGDYPPERVGALCNYVYNRPKGEPSQELGGVMVTLAAYAWAHGLDTDAAAETELARIWTKVDVIRAKQAAKPTGSALPIAVEPSTEGSGWREALELPHPGPLAHKDACCLSLYFNRGASLQNPQHYRINEWLKKLIEFAPDHPLASPQAGGWRPIESAPKDGTRFLGAVYHPGDGKWSQAVLYVTSQGEVHHWPSGGRSSHTLWQPLPPLPQDVARP